MIKVTTLSFVPLYEQIKMQIKYNISIGDLRPSDPLPSIRDLATQLVINPNTAARAYREPEMGGFIYTRKGKGCYVTNDFLPLIHEERKKILNKIFDDAINQAKKFNLALDKIRELFEQRFDLLKSEKEKEG
jgi:GntR family transcriptional regulator